MPVRWGNEAVLQVGTVSISFTGQRFKIDHKVVLISRAVWHLNSRGLWGNTDSPLCSPFISFVLISISILWTWSPLSVVGLGDWIASSSLPRVPCSTAVLAAVRGGETVVAACLSVSLSNRLANKPLVLHWFLMKWFELWEHIAQPRRTSPRYTISSPSASANVIFHIYRERWTRALFYRSLIYCTVSLYMAPLQLCWRTLK